MAIIAVYGEDVVQQDLPADEMLLHFSSLSMHMSGDVVLRKVKEVMISASSFIRSLCHTRNFLSQTAIGMQIQCHISIFIVCHVLNMLKYFVSTG